ncbi:MAG: peptidylprolyl isomerase [Clostridia bacterium]|nr:peptidylprolyl isomerase [Clostridia bacterium]
MFTLSNQETDFVKIEMTSGDSMVVKLDGKNAPITVANFKKLVGQGFYNGLIFHRVISGFMIQGGDPEGTGMGGSKENIRGEFLYNGVKNTISHVRGVISMARAQHPNSASSQFFICHADAKFLDGQYAAFGRVVEGIETVDKIAAVATNYNDKPLTPQVMAKVYFVTK